MGFIQLLNDSVKHKKITDECEVSQVSCNVILLPIKCVFSRIKKPKQTNMKHKDHYWQSGWLVMIFSDTCILHKLKKLKIKTKLHLLHAR